MKIKAFLKAVFIGDTTFVEPSSPAEYLAEIAKLQEDLRLARCAHRASARRISTFGMEYPELHKLHFTKAGDALRKGAVREAA